MVIILASDNPMYIDATMRSMELMWKDHPEVIAPNIFGKTIRKKLKDEFDLNFCDRNVLDYLYTKKLCIFTNPVVYSPRNIVHLDITNKMIGIDNNILNLAELSSSHPYFYEMIHNSSYLQFNDANEQFRWVVDKQQLINIIPNSEPSTNKYLAGHRININKYLYQEYDSPTITDDLFYEWVV